MKTKYICEYTKQEFDTQEEALLSEKNNKQTIFRSIFPRTHRSDDNYNTHCIKCGSLLLQYDSVYDGHRNERGNVLINKNRTKIFESWFCDPCHIQTLDILTDIIINNRDKFDSECSK